MAIVERFRRLSNRAFSVEDDEGEDAEGDEDVVFVGTFGSPSRQERVEERAGEAEGLSTSHRILPVRRTLNRSVGPVPGEPSLGAEGSKRASTSRAVMPSHVSALPSPSQDGGKEHGAGTFVVNPFQAIQASLDRVVTLVSSAEEMVREHESALPVREAEALARADNFYRLYEETREELACKRGFNSTLARQQAEALEKVRALEVELKVIGEALSEKTVEPDDLRARLSRDQGSVGPSFRPVPPGFTPL